ncbi:hypothetical protein [Streptomyces rubiginosohelvolus]|uniref:hypothetical protein n=1 Tax=Streptomyces rubiginosohelvolus TaxID=67362 RepID=UPI0033A76E6D
MSVDLDVDPSLAHRLPDPTVWAVVAKWLTAQAQPRPIPETFRGPNWKDEG